ncbi:rhamnogalacturonan acetylesterase [Haloferula helveola]|uniref:Rhamnogalacturonan acetylesterase n=1 Tax=Haloferula helveola TaxID=490095 RepID=A0ABN6GZ96_9BACT|nr:rhamnogalacturonan acetylesterase [Haloferula helveola]
MMKRLLSVLAVFAWAGIASAEGENPTLWIIGDSTVRNSTPGQMGWGDCLGEHFDKSGIEVVNRAIGGRSSRTFRTEGRWDAVMANLREGDYVLMQFGHNDGGEMFAGDRPRASIKGNGEEMETGTVKATGKEEVVRSYGWYLRRYAREARERGATPVILSLIPRNIWKDGRITRNGSDYGLWARQAASQEDVAFIDFNSLLADSYEDLGPDATSDLFCGTDHTHTGPEGAAFNAAKLAAAIRGLDGCPLASHLKPVDLWMPSVFSDHMVLQRDLDIPVWGTAEPGAEVEVTLAGESRVVRAGPKGRWRLRLPPLEAGGPYRMVVSSSATRSFEDVMVGEVWLCSGQSNMDFTVAPTEKRPWSGTANWEKEVAAADSPGIRMFTAEWALHESPQADVAGEWKVCSPQAVGDFSAVAYFFGRDLQDALDVPVGLIACAFGGSTAEAWISDESLRAHPQFEPLLKAYRAKCLQFRDDPEAMRRYGADLERWRKAADDAKAAGRKAPKAPKHPDPVQDQHNPAVLFNGMIAPIVSYGLRGAIWYQGESNVGTREIYGQLQKTLIHDWRSRWSIGDFPFYFVQLAGYREPKTSPAESSLAQLREAQAEALELPNTGMAVAIDLGESADIHPRNKQDVGHRLARLAISETYGVSMVAGGPVMKDAVVADDVVRVRFDRVAGGLMAKSGPLRGFEVAGDDGEFVWATAVIEGESVLVSHPDISDPVHVRYAWADHPQQANLCNSEGLPAAPFRTGR